MLGAFIVIEVARSHFNVKVVAWSILIMTISEGDGLIVAK